MAKLPKRISEISRDGDGWWAITSPGWRIVEMDSHVAHEPTKKQLLSVLKRLEPCACEDCQIRKQSIQ